MTEWQVMNPTPWAKEDGFMELYGKMAKTMEWKYVSQHLQKVQLRSASDAANLMMVYLHTVSSDERVTLVVDNLPPAGTNNVYKLKTEFPVNANSTKAKVILITFIHWAQATLKEGFKMDGGSIGMFESSQPETFLNNRYINACFFTTYASVLASALQRGVSWFTFVNPSIGAPASTSENRTTETLDGGKRSSEINPNYQYDEVKVEKGSPRAKRGFRPLNQKARKQKRQEMEEAASKLKLRVANVKCPADHELKSKPSQTWDLIFGETVQVDMAPEAELVKIERDRQAFKSKRRFGNKRRQNSPEPEKKPREKLVKIVDEDGFEMVSGKRVARIPQKPEEKLDSADDQVPKPSPKSTQIKLFKTGKPLEPSGATLLHEKAQLFELLKLITQEEEEVTDKKEDRTLGLVREAQNAERKKKNKKVHKKETLEPHTFMMEFNKYHQVKIMEEWNNLKKAGILVLLFFVLLAAYFAKNWCPPERVPSYHVAKIESPQLDSFKYPSIDRNIAKFHTNKTIFDYSQPNAYNVCLIEAMMG